MPSPRVELERFVHDALAKGQSWTAIRAALAAAGWTEAQTRGVLDRYAEVAFPLPVPKPRASVSAREAVQYLVLFATLYLTVYHLGNLLFGLVDRWMPDPAAEAFAPGDDAMRFSIASLLIAFPVYATMAVRVAREADANPILRLSLVRRWLTYLTLLAAGVALIGDMTTLVYNLLGGEATPRFLARAAIVALIAGGIFAYYLRDLRREEVAP